MVQRTTGFVQKEEGEQSLAKDRRCSTCDGRLCLPGYECTIEVTTRSGRSKGIFCSWECHKEWEEC